MVNNEIVNYIKLEIERGVAEQDITSSLIKAGWQVSDVQEAFNSLHNAPFASSAVPPAVIPEGNAASSAPSQELITEENYPITVLWIFKAPIIILAISFVAFLFGYWFPYLVILLPIYLIANPLIRANFHYSTESKFFLVKQGVFSKKQRNLPYGVIQNVLVKQDWFDRVFGLASLSVENAAQGGGSKKFQWWGKRSNYNATAYNQQEAVGASGNKVNIPGLKKRDAEALKNIILQKMKENPVEEAGL